MSKDVNGVLFRLVSTEQEAAPAAAATEPQPESEREPERERQSEREPAEQLPAQGRRVQRSRQLPRSVPTFIYLLYSIGT